MDESQILLQLFSNVGIPSAICFYTLFHVKNSLDKLTDAIDALKDNHYKEISSLKDEVKELKYKFNSIIARIPEVNHNENTH